MPIPHASDSTDSPNSVVSPLGVRLVSGLVAPFLSPRGQADLEDRWGRTSDELFESSLKAAEEFRGIGAVHMALGAWTRRFQIPPVAVTRLGGVLGDLPHNDTEAQALLNTWTRDHTNDLILSFPAQVEKDTVAVLGSAVAVEDTWNLQVVDQDVFFNQQRRKGFSAQADPASVMADETGRTVRAVLPLRSGATLNLCRSLDGPGVAQAMVCKDDYFVEAVNDSMPTVGRSPVHAPTPLVRVVAPEFTISTRHNLMEQAAQWGLAGLVADGAPGLGGLEVSQAAQEAFIEVTHTGVKAAAVTGMAMMASAMWSYDDHEQHLVEFDDEFAFALMMPGISTPLFEGVFFS